MSVVTISFAVKAENVTYHGTVLDATSHEPLIGATVVPVGGGQGAACDLDGKFTIDVPSDVTKAKISYVGYETQTVTLSQNMTVLLNSTATNLNDVVVVAYGTSTKESLTGSVAVVDARQIEDRPVTSATAALEGLAPGVQINSSTAQPGEDPQIRIRGFNSIKGVNSPLYVVDGTVYSGDISAINPADVESISVLKDAASCALYGNKGANGVILITTKKAKNIGKVDLTLQVRQGIYNRALPEYSRLGITPWMETSLTGLANGLVTSGNFSNLADSYTYARNNFFSEFKAPNIFNAENGNVFNSDNRLAASVLPGYNDLDWWKNISRNGYRQEYNVSTSSAGEKYNLFASAGYLKENGYILASDFERFNGRISVNVNPVSFLKFGMNLFASQSESERSPVESDELGYTNNPFLFTTFNAPILPYYQHNSDGSVALDADGNPIWNTADYNQGTNICWQLREDKNNFSSTTIDGTIYGTAVIPYGFELTLKGQMYRNKQNQTSYNNNLVGSQKDVGGIDEIFYDTRNSTFLQQLTWSHEYGLNHIDVLLDHENYEWKYGYSFLRKSNQQLPGSINLNNFADVDQASESRVQLNTESYLGRVRYNYDQKYFGEASIRRDGSSRFAKENRWGTFWSVGASWMISKEKFMQKLPWVNYLKLRAAYGSVGNDNTVDATGRLTYYPSYPLYGYGFTLNNNIIVLQPSQLAPDNLKWESTKTLDVALEGSLFNDRLSFSVGYYNKRNSDLIFPVSAPLSAGTMDNMGANPTVLQNIGSMENIGWELSFGVDIIRNAELTWNFNVDASFLKNKILKLPNNQDIPGESLFIGKSLYEQYTYEWAGIDKLTGQSLYSMEPYSPDYYSYENGQKVYNESLYLQNEQAAADAGALVEIDGKKYTTNRAYAGRKIIGTSLPTVYGSFGTNLSWKGINLGMLFTYSLGGKSYDSNYARLMNLGSSATALHSDLLNAWTAPTSDHHEIDPNGVPQLNTTNASYNNAGSSRWLVSNDYLTFKNLNISYDFPAKWVSAMKMQNLNLGFSIDNVFIASKRKGFNPQYSFNGAQGAYFVPARVYSFQLTVKF